MRKTRLCLTVRSIAASPAARAAESRVACAPETVESSLTSLYPHARVSLTERVDTWGLVGFGCGEITIRHARGDQARTAHTADTPMRKGALGVRGEVPTPVQYPYRIAHALHEENLDARFPEAALDLLNRTVGDEARHFREELAPCLTAIRAADRALEDDHRFRRLVAIVRADSGELD